jgi:hypothetical protein
MIANGFRRAIAAALTPLAGGSTSTSHVYSQKVRDLRALARRNQERFRTLVARGKELGLW